MEKFEPRFPRIIARTEEEKKEEKKMLKESYLKFRREIAPYEIPKTEKEETLPIIKDMQSAVQKILGRYRDKPELFPEQRIFFLKRHGVESYTYGEGDLKSALFNYGLQYIALNRNPSDAETALHLAHELFHANSPAAVGLAEGKRRAPLWSGIIVYEKKGKIAQINFREIGEAIIDELTNQVYQKEIKKNPRYQKEVKDNERILPWIKKLVKWKGWDKKREKIYLSGFYAIPEMVELIYRSQLYC